MSFDNLLLERGPTTAPLATQYIIEAVNRGLDASFEKGQFLEA